MLKNVFDSNLIHSLCNWRRAFHITMYRNWEKYETGTVPHRTIAHDIDELWEYKFFFNLVWAWIHHGASEEQPIEKRWQSHANWLRFWIQMLFGSLAQTIKNCLELWYGNEMRLYTKKSNSWSTIQKTHVHIKRDSLYLIKKNLKMIQWIFF